MKFAGSQAMKAMDDYAIHQMGIPSDTLMLRAAAGAAKVACELLGAAPKKAVIFCGSGNNGGDGIAVGKLLLEQGYQVTCFMVGSREKMTSDSLLMEQLLEKQGGQLLDYDPERATLSSCDLIVDALFGTGLSREISGKYADLIQRINESGIPVLSCDIPSGISADTGAVLGCAVRASVTVTFNLPKTGQLLPPGTEYTGRLVVHDIGIPQEARDTVTFDGEYVTEDMVRLRLPKGHLETHKGDYGKLLLLCGSTGYTGAAALAAKAALRTGAGLVFLGVPETVYPILASKLDEPVVFPLKSNEQGRFGEGAVPEISKRLGDMDACLLGPGIGKCAGTEAVLDAVLEQAVCPVLLDADGINLLEGHIDKLDRAKAPLVLTPHEGEFRRLGGDLSKGRIAAAKAMAEKTGAVVVLKGYRTITAAPDGRVYVNSTGNPGMATGGSGDVLSGILTCLLGQGVEPFQAAAAAVWLHGAAGDVCEKRLGRRSMLPTDMIGALSTILR
jgi:NAD(P)H-hydrate epimerase